VKVAVVTLGSAGDLHPFLAIARELQRRGHEVHVLTQQPYEAEVRGEGLAFIPVVTTEAHVRTMQHPLLWHPLHGFGVLWRHLAVPAIGPTCDALGTLGPAAGEPLFVLASPLAVGARFARERWPDAVHLLSIYTAPMAIRSTADPMFIGSWRVPNWCPVWLRRGFWSLLDRWKLEPLARPALTHWQRHWNTPPISTSTFAQWVHSPDGGVAMFPAWFAPPRESLRDRCITFAGFPLYRPTAQTTLSPELEQFLATQGRTAVIYPGSAALQSERMIHLGMTACRQLGLPCVVLARELTESSASEVLKSRATLHVTWTSLSELLKRCCVLIHHGGIGTCAQAMNTATPQLILASAYDQFENGARLEALGAAKFWNVTNATVEDIQRALQAPVLRSLRVSAQHLHAPKQTGQDAVDVACMQVDGPAERPN
jgi:rhamnosyltransferase subunit B